MEFDILCFPICGGSFPCLISLCISLLRAKKKINEKYYPDICLGSSGGSIASIIGIACEWDPDKMEEMTKRINSDFFIERLVPNELSFIPENFFMAKKLSFYDINKKGYLFFKEKFETVDIKNTELWIGTYNVDDQKARFFCNKEKSEALINNYQFDIDIGLSLSNPSYYCNGDVELIYSVCMASCAIPYVVPSQRILNKHYNDGGIMYASPLGVLYSEIYNILTDNDHKDDIPETETNSLFFKLNNKPKSNLRLYYFIYGQKLMTNETDNNFIYNIFVSALNSSTMKDRNDAIKLLKMLCSDIKLKCINKVKNLEEILIEYDKYKHYVICFFPHGLPCLDITNFTCCEVENIMKQCQENYGCYIWHSIDLA